MKAVTVYEFPHGDGVRVARGDHVISAASGVPVAIRDYANIKQAYAAERGKVRALIARMMLDVPLRSW